MIDKWQKRMEKVTANAVFRALQKQKRDLQEYLKNTGMPNDGMLKVVLNRSGNAVVDGFISRAKTTISRAYNDAGKKGPEPLGGLDFSLPTRPEAVYLRSLQDLHLSQRKGSISATTEERVKKAVTNGIKQGQSAKEIAENIEKLDPQVFSKNRADLIAINQIGKAKQFGEFTAMKEFHDAGYVVLKYWSTVNDSRVTRTHTANQGDGWIFQDKAFSGTGDLIPPASDNPRCRCACLYDIGDLKGRKQPKGIQQKLTAQENKENHQTFLQKIKSLYKPEEDINTKIWLDTFEEVSDLKKLEKLYPFLTKEEIISAYTYTGNAHQQMNFMLRNHIINQYFLGYTTNLESMLNALPIYRGTVWRGINAEKIEGEKVIEKIQNLKEGDIFFDGGFVSTSQYQKTAKDFAKNDGILLKIENAIGHDISDFSSLTEDEILLNNGKNLLFLGKRGNIFIFKQL